MNFRLAQKFPPASIFVPSRSISDLSGSKMAFFSYFCIRFFNCNCFNMSADNIIFTLHLASILSMFLSGVYILVIRGTRPPLVYLSLERFLFTFLVALNLFQTSPTPIYGQVLWNPLHVLMLLTFPSLLFAYIFGMSHPGSTGVRFWLLAYLPVTALVILYLIFEMLFGHLPLCSTYADVRRCLHLPQMWVVFAGAGFAIAMISIYTARAIRLLRQHRRNLESNFSYTEGSTLNWMWWIIALTLTKCLIHLTKIMLEGIISTIGLTFYSLEPVIITILVLRQNDLYRAPASGSEVISAQKNDPSEWSLKKRKKLQRDLLVLLRKDEIFKDPELGNEKVCEMLGTNRTYLWQVITHDMNTSFYKLINTWRLNKATTMMKDPQHQNMPLKNIAEICGFKSLCALSVLFKQTHGKTPTEWREEACQEENT